MEVRLIKTEGEGIFLPVARVVIVQISLKKKRSWKKTFLARKIKILKTPQEENGNVFFFRGGSKEPPLFYFKMKYMKYYRKKYKGINILARKKSQIFYIEYTMRLIDFILSVDKKRFGFVTCPKYILLFESDTEREAMSYGNLSLVVFPLNLFYVIPFPFIASVLIHETRHIYQRLMYPKKESDSIWAESDACGKEIVFLKKLKESYRITECEKWRDECIERFKKVTTKDSKKAFLQGYDRTQKQDDEDERDYLAISSGDTEFIDVQIDHQSNSYKDMLPISMRPNIRKK